MTLTVSGGRQTANMGERYFVSERKEKAGDADCDKVRRERETQQKVTDSGRCTVWEQT